MLSFIEHRNLLKRKRIASQQLVSHIWSVNLLLSELGTSLVQENTELRAQIERLQKGNERAKEYLTQIQELEDRVTALTTVEVYYHRLIVQENMVLKTQITEARAVNERLAHENEQLSQQLATVKKAKSPRTSPGLQDQVRIIRMTSKRPTGGTTEII